MHFPVAVRTERYGVLNRIWTTLGKPDDVMALEIGISIVVKKGRQATAQLAVPISSAFCPHGNIWIPLKGGCSSNPGSRRKRLDEDLSHGER